MFERPFPCSLPVGAVNASEFQYLERISALLLPILCDKKER